MRSLRLLRFRGLPVVVVLAAALLAPGSVSAQSAFPLKSGADSGVVPTNEVNPSNYVDAGPGSGYNYVRGFDACTYLAAYNNFSLNYQQYNVGNCVPIQTPWIELKGWETKGWAIYCPASAPNSWIYSLGGALQQWTSDVDVEGMNEVQSQNSFGPSPPAKSDYYTTNWGFHKNYWLFLVGCSPQPWQNVGDGGTYCCGQGTSAIPNFSTTSAAAAAKRRGGGILRKGPARRRQQMAPGLYSVTREVDLRPDTRVTYRLKCRRGYKLRQAREAVGWFLQRKPRKSDGAVREQQERFGERGYQVTVKTDDRVKPGKARLQLEISCGKPGAVGPPPRPAGPFS